MTYGLPKGKRDQLRLLVGKLRSTSEGAIKVRLYGFGIRDDCGNEHAHEEECFIRPVGKLRLSARDLQLYESLLAAIERERVGFENIGEPERTRLAIRRYLEGCAYTFVNRLAALRAMEVRGLLSAESIVKREKYSGMSQREWRLFQERSALQPDDLLRRTLEEAMQEAAQEIAVLFDPLDQYVLLWPDAHYLRQLLEIIGSEIGNDFWKSDDILGWAYQYYNEDKRKAYKRRGAPKPDDIPIINQLYTPHWIVKALVDNTLGRLYMEMQGHCPWKENPELPKEAEDGVGGFCSYLVPLTSPPSERETKHPKEIKVLDPACGSGHFLIYAFDVLWRIWKEAEPDLPDDRIASSILKYNLYGIDIDLRACELAALGLYLKAKSYVPSVRVKALNVVCADVRVLEGESREAFLQRFEDDPDLKAIIERLLEQLGYTFEIGSLLKVREPFREMLSQRHPGKEIQARFTAPGIGQTGLTTKEAVAPQARLRVGETHQISDEVAISIPATMTLSEIRDMLSQFESEAMEKNDMGSLLFAADTERSVGLLTLLTQEYDVVLTNPPYGGMPPKCKSYAREHYKRTHSDYYAAFIEQSISLCEPSGFVGALTGRTFMFLKSHQKLREQILREQALPELVFDLNAEPKFGVLDGATARWTAFTLRKRTGEDSVAWADHSVTFLSLLPWPSEVKIQYLEATIERLNQGEKGATRLDGHRVYYAVTLGRLAEVPGTPFSYWAPSGLRELFRKYPPLDRDASRDLEQAKIADVKKGFTSGDDMRFLRFWWEVPVEHIATSRQETTQRKQWVPLAKGGMPFFHDIRLVVNWGNDGEEIRKFALETGRAYIRNEDYYFREGLAWADIVSGPQLDLHVLPEGCIFISGAHAAFPKDAGHSKHILAWGNSALVWLLFQILDPLAHHKNVGHVSRLPVPPGLLENEKLVRLSEDAIRLIVRFETGDETSTLFSRPWILQVLRQRYSQPDASIQHPLLGNFTSYGRFSAEVRKQSNLTSRSLRKLAHFCTHIQRDMQRRFRTTLGAIDREVYVHYGFGDGQRDELHELMPSIKYSIPTLSAREHTERLISFYVREILRADSDGIIPITSGLPDSLIPQIWKRFEADVGSEPSAGIERELEQILGQSLEDWIYEEYLPLHIKMYENRPAHWLVSSQPKSRSRDPAFACLVRYLRLTKDTIPKIRTLYVRKVLEDARIRSERLSRELSEARADGRRPRANRLSKQAYHAKEIVAELEEFTNRLNALTTPEKTPRGLPEGASWVRQKIAEVSQTGYRPNIDYGVFVNISPLRDAGLLHKAANRVK